MISLKSYRSMEINSYMNEVTPGVYVGSISAANNWDILRQNAITHVLTIHVTPIDTKVGTAVLAECPDLFNSLYAVIYIWQTCKCRLHPFESVSFGQYFV